MQDAAPFRLGDWLVEPELNQVSRDGEPQHLEAKSMDVLAYLARHADEVVSTDELLEAVWPDTVVEAAVVHRRINQIRHALGDDPKAPRYIQTILKRGYKVVARVERIDSIGADATQGASAGSAAGVELIGGEQVSASEAGTAARPVTADEHNVVRESASSSRLVPGSSDADPPPERADVVRSGRRSLMVAVLFVSLGVVGTLILRQTQVGRAPPAAIPSLGPVLRVPLKLDGWVGWRTVNPGNPTPSIAMSPAGDQLAYVVRDDQGVRRLAVCDLDGMDVRELPGTEGAEKPFFSPDGRWVGYFDSQVMKRVPLEGGEPSIITALSNRSWGASWGENGRIVFAEAVSGLSSILVTGGDKRMLTQLTGVERNHRLPRHVTGTDLLLFTKYIAGDIHEVWTVNMKTGEQKRLVGGLAAVYVEGGYLLFAERESDSRGSLWAIQFDPSTVEVRGKPRLIQGPIAGGRGSAFAAARTGSIVYLPSGRLPSGELIVLQPDGSTHVVDRGGVFRGPRLSHDGMRLAVERLRVKNQGSIWIYDIATGVSTQFASDGMFALWDPDDDGISYFEADIGLVHQAFDSPADPELLEAPGGEPVAWVDDGAALLFMRAGALWRHDRKSVRLGYDGASFPSIVANGTEQWLAFCTWPSGIRIARFPEPTGVVVASESGCAPKWAPDGSRLYYQDDGAVFSIDVALGERPTLGERRRIAFADFPSGFPRFDVAADGRIVLARTVYDDAKQPVLLVNWQQFVD